MHPSCIRRAPVVHRAQSGVTLAPRAQRKAHVLDVIALWTGHRASAFRAAYRMTVEAFAEQLGVAVRTVATWQAQPDIVPTPAMQEALDTALDRAPGPVRARLSLLLADGSLGFPAGPAGTGGRDAGAMEAFRLADLRVGGGYLYPAVAGYLRDEVAPRLVALGAQPGGQEVFTAAAAITEMAGWMAHDAGSDDLAGAHFSRALDLVRAAGDRRVKAHILASLSHLEEHLRRPDNAVRLARAGREALAGGPRSPDLEARLYALEARGQAALRNGHECIRLLKAAEQAITARPAEEPSSWVSGFDEGALANEAARCMRYLGDLGEARRQAARILVLRPASRARSRAFGQLMLAGTLAQLGRHDEACAVASEIIDATPALGSHVVIQQLRDLARLLGPHRSNGPVREFLSRLDADIRQRQGLFRQPGNGTLDAAASMGGPG